MFHSLLLVAVELLHRIPLLLLLLLYELLLFVHLFLLLIFLPVGALVVEPLAAQCEVARGGVSPAGTAAASRPGTAETGERST